MTSLRRGSFNAQLARAVVKLAPADFGIHFLTAAGLPATMCSKRPRELEPALQFTHAENTDSAAGSSG